MERKTASKFIGLLLILIFTGVSYSQPTQEQRDAFQSVQKVRVLTEHLLFKGSYTLSFDYTTSSHFEKTAKRLLESIEIEVVENDSADYDAIVRINARSILYNDPNPNNPNPSCRLSGSISMEMPGVPVYQKDFLRQIYSMNMVYDLTYLVRYIDSVDMAVTLAPGSFTSTMYGFIAEVFSFDYLMSEILYGAEISKINAATAAGELKDNRAAEVLIRALQDEKKDVRATAAQALGELTDPRSVESLVSALKDKYARTRMNAALALIKTRYEQPTATAYADNLSKIKAKNIKHLSMAILSQMEDNQGIMNLVEDLKNTNPAIRAKAAEALSSTVNTSHTTALESLTLALNDQKNEVRAYAAYALGKIEDARVVEQLIKTLKDPEGWIRRNTARALGKIRDERAVEPLIQLLGDKETYTREEAAWALGEIKDERAIEPLILSFETAPFFAIWSNIEALRKFGEPAVDPLIVALTHDVNKIRLYSVVALGLINNRDAVEPIVSMLDDDYVRSYAITSLALLDDARAIGSLIRLLDDEDADVRNRSAKALKKMTGQLFGGNRPQWEEWWGQNRERLL